MDGLSLAGLPQGCSLRFNFTDDYDIPYADTPYTATYTNGRVTYGVTDQNGYTSIIYSVDEESVSVHLDI